MCLHIPYECSFISFVGEMEQNSIAKHLAIFYVCKVCLLCLEHIERSFIKVFLADYLYNYKVITFEHYIEFNRIQNTVPNVY